MNITGNLLIIDHPEHHFLQFFFVKKPPEVSNWCVLNNIYDNIDIVSVEGQYWPANESVGLLINTKSICKGGFQPPIQR